MGEITVNGALLRDMIVMGAALLEKNKAHIDSLNVFPVPDGDTGTNMSMTMHSAVKELKNRDAQTVSEVAEAVSLGALKGARGNSGVILSQLFRGFARALKDQETMDAEGLERALTMGMEAAYKAVMKPKEGTILTVSRMIAQEVQKARQTGANVYRLVDVMLDAGEVALSMTPELLPVLKEAGVVDSGGKGLLTIYKGFKMAIDGEELEDIDEAAAALPQEDEADFTLEDTESISFCYCTEFFIIRLDESFREEDLDRLREKLTRIGDSVVVAHDGGYVKVHVHSNAPGKIIQLALRLGEVDKIKIENMREQNREIQDNLKKNEKEYGVVAVSAGPGITSVFTDLGVGAVIEGGQTMNPSIEAISRAIRKVNARNVFVFPNNPNIILAARQAAALSERNVIIIPTRNIIQGISGVLMFNPELTPAENEARINEAYEGILTGAVTYAVRSTSFNGTKIAQGDIIGLMDEDIVAVGDNVDAPSIELLEKLIQKNGEEDCIVTLFYGENVDEENAKALVKEMEQRYPEAEFIIQNGGQPLYYYYFSVE